MGQKLLRWFGFSVVFSLLPFLFNGIVYLGVRNRPPFSWFLLWPHGELLLVSAGFAADAVGEVVGVGGRYRTAKVGAGCFCVVCVAVEAFSFAAVQSPTAAFDPVLVTGWSVSLFVVTLVAAATCKMLGSTK